MGDRLLHMDESNLVVGVAWYRADQYSLLRALAADPDSMAETYDEWLARVNRTMDDLCRQGLIARKVDIDVQELAAWCHERGKPLDGAARAAYAAEKVPGS